jgi:hypothetical protein
MRGATGAGGDQGGAVAGETGDTVDPHRLDGLGEGHRGQDGGEPPGQHGLARPGRANEEDVMVRTPAYHFASPMSLRMLMDPLLNLLVKQPNEYGAIP